MRRAGEGGALVTRPAKMTVNLVNRMRYPSLLSRINRCDRAAAE